MDKRIAVFCEGDDLNFVLIELERGLKSYKVVRFTKYELLKRGQQSTSFAAVVMVRSAGGNIFGYGLQLSDKFPGVKVIYYGNFPSGEMERSNNLHMVQMTSKPEEDAVKILDLIQN